MLRRLSLFLLPLLLVGTTAAAQSASISFNADWSVNASASPLPAGAQVAISYDANRLPGCRGTTNTGGPAWSITGYYRFNDGAVQSFWVAGHSPDGNTAQPVITLPAGRSGGLALWFQVTNMWGCSEWDSNYGHNHTFTVGLPTLLFANDWSEAVYGTPRAGQSFVVDYDISRLSGCRQTYNGMDTWDVAVQYRFDGGAVQEQSLTVVNGYQRSRAPITLSAPAGARQVEMWFKKWDRTSCVSWDSNYGANYRFNLQ